MKLKEYIAALNKIAEENPESLEFEVVYSKDIEGNWFSRVYYEPTLGYYKDNKFIDTNSEDLEDKIVNSICIN